jgi:hypothetical protein
MFRSATAEVRLRSRLDARRSGSVLRNCELPCLPVAVSVAVVSPITLDPANDGRDLALDSPE